MKNRVEPTEFDANIELEKYENQKNIPNKNGNLRLDGVTIRFLIDFNLYLKYPTEGKTFRLI